MSKGLSILDGNISVSGNIFSEGDMDISGQITGSVVASAISVKEGGVINGNVYANELSMVKGGEIKGNVFAKKIKLLKGAKILGEIKYTFLSMEAGAVIECSCSCVEENIIDDLCVKAKSSMENAE